MSDNNKVKKPRDGSVQIAKLERLINYHQELVDKYKIEIGEIKFRQSQRKAKSSHKLEDVAGGLVAQYQAMGWDELWEEAGKYDIDDDSFEGSSVGTHELIKEILVRRLVNSVED